MGRLNKPFFVCPAVRVTLARAWTFKRRSDFLLLNKLRLVKLVWPIFSLTVRGK